MLLLIALYTISKVNNIHIPISTKTMSSTLPSLIQFYEIMATRNPTMNAITTPNITNIAILSNVLFPVDILMM